MTRGAKLRKTAFDDAHLPTMACREVCCLCNKPIRGKAVKVPVDEGTGERTLPPVCLALAQERGAPATGWLHREAGHWCYMDVTQERERLREQRVVRGGYDAGAVQPHLQVARQPLEKLNLGAVNLDGPAALGVLLVVTPRKEAGKTGSPATRQRPPGKRPVGKRQRIDAGGGAGSSAR